VESSAGFAVDVLQPDHPVIRGLPWDDFPPIFGYNELAPREGAEVLVSIGKAGHPLVVTGAHGDGRILIYASDPAPHWGINFELWAGYDAFWQQALSWVRSR
jgi:uncharacterized membrane protein